MHESRQSRRLNVPLKVEISHPTLGRLDVEARDMSDGGIFVFLDPDFQLPVGEIITAKVLGLGGSDKDPSPTLNMRIVRAEKDGMGLSIVEAASNKPQNLFSIRQSLFIFSSKKNILLLENSPQNSPQWTLPNRLMQTGEGWQQGLSLCISQYKDLLDIPLPTPGHHCLASSNHLDIIDNTIEFIVPCAYTGSENLGDEKQLRYRWSSADEVAQLFPHYNNLKTLLR